MPDGQPIAPDIDVLEGFNEPFILNDLPRDERMSLRWDCSIKQVYAIWDKKRDALEELKRYREGN